MPLSLGYVYFTTKKQKPERQVNTVKNVQCKESTLKQICELIPPQLVPRLARKHGVDKRARKFTPFSHVVSMLYAHLTHALSLNDICDAIRNFSGLFVKIRGCHPPHRNTLSYANRNRDSAMAEDLFWHMVDHLTAETNNFGYGKRSSFYKKLPRRFKRTINIIDSTTIQLVANCIDWASHRRRKAAAKCHMRLNLQTFLPSFVIIETAKHNDASRARELCAGVEEGEIVVFDKAYNDFDHLHDLTVRKVFWVGRAKDNMNYHVRKHLQKKPKGNILQDSLIRLKGSLTRKKYGKDIRLVRALVEVDKKTMEMIFITNNFEWSANSICDLYQSRWGIEVFFKQMKQNLQLSDFLGHNQSAIQWQVWMALLTYLLLRYLVYVSKWAGAFSRMYTMLRAVLWGKFKVIELLQSYGTAPEQIRMRAAPEMAYLPGFKL